MANEIYDQWYSDETMFWRQTLRIRRRWVSRCQCNLARTAIRAPQSTDGVPRYAIECCVFLRSPD